MPIVSFAQCSRRSLDASRSRSKEALTIGKSFNNRTPGPKQRSMSTLEDQVAGLTAQLAMLQAQQAATPKAPKIAAPTPFSGSHDDLDRFKAECWVYLAMRHAEFPDDRSKILFVLSYMKGGMAGPWAAQKINALLDLANPEHASYASLTFDAFVADEMDAVFADPNREASARRLLATARQGNDSVKELIRKFEIHGPTSQLGDVGLIDRFDQALHPRLRESIYHLRPMPATWQDWKREASLLDNQWRRLANSRSPLATTSFAPSYTRPNFSCSPATSYKHKPRLPPQPEPMELDRANRGRKDP